MFLVVKKKGIGLLMQIVKTKDSAILVVLACVCLHLAFLLFLLFFIESPPCGASC